MFLRTYNPSPSVVRLVYEVLDYFEANPNRWDQESYGSATTETNCFMGGVIRLSGADPYSDEYDNMGYCIWSAMKILGLDYDRAAHIAYWRSGYSANTKPTIDELRERVSEALNYDFRKPKNELPCGCVPHKTRMTDFGLYCDTEQQGYCNFECGHDEN